MSETTTPERNPLHGVIASWALAAVVVIAVGIAFEQFQRAPWLVVGFALVVVVSFAIQLWYAAPSGFIFRVAASVGGALVIMGAISLTFGMVALANL